MSICRSCGSDNPDGFRFCGSCGTLLETDEVSVREERKVVTVVFTDIVGSTARAETLDPEDVRAILAPYYLRLRQELERFGGTVEKFIGDAVVAVFGAPAAHEDDAERAVRAALAIRTSIADLNAADEWLDLHIRTGVNTGEALVVLDARPIEGEGMVSGDVINTAARLQSNAPVDGILVGELTHRVTAHIIEYQQAEPVQAKGKVRPLSVWEAVRAKEPPSLRSVATRPLIGRDDEMNRLLRVWESVRNIRSPALVTVIGSAGVGKSRFFAEFATRVEGVANVHRGRCLSYGEGITYWPIADIMKDAAGILQNDGLETMSAKLGELLESLNPPHHDDMRTMASALANLLGAPTTPKGTYHAEAITRSELHWGIRRVFQLLSARLPLVLFLEDLHWAEPTLLELIRYISEPMRNAPVLVVASARPEQMDQDSTILRGGGGEGRREVIELEALGERESRALIAELYKTRELSDAVVESLLDAAGGNPLFLEETVGMLADATALERNDSGPTGSLEMISVPSSLQSLIGARLDQLPAHEKPIAQHASVAGSTFWEGAMAHLDVATTNLVGGLRGLERRDLIRRLETSSVAGEREYAFKHTLIREVAYGQLPKGLRTKLHVRFADWVAALPGAEDEFVEIVAYHLEQACRLAHQIARSPTPPPVEPAVEALVAAAERAEKREGIREAERFYERALEILGDAHSQTNVRLRLRRAEILAVRGELRRAFEDLVDVGEESRVIGRADLRGAALIALANIDQKQGRAADARRRLLEAETIAFEIGDRRLQIRSGYEFAGLRADFYGEEAAAVEDLRRSLAIATAIEDRALRIEGHLRIGMMLLNSGDVSSAQEEFLRCSALASEMGSRRDEARATYALGVAKYYMGELREAEVLGLRAREWLKRTGDNYFQIQNLLALAYNALGKEEPKLAEEWLSEALPLALEGGGWLVVEIYRFMVEALVLQGRLEDARELATFARTSVPEEDLNARAEVLIAEAHVAAAEGDRLHALEFFAEAVSLLEAQDSQLLLAETRVAFARALRDFGDIERSAAELERARTTFVHMGARGLIAQVDRELGATIKTLRPLDHP
jgi:predicted ATPase/class 3 adenylate cyclase